MVTGYLAMVTALLLCACSGGGDGNEGTLQIAAASQRTAAPPPSRRPDADHPVVLELYQSQGCSSCPPANANLNVLSRRADVLALSFAVTYWDQLGWRDRFADPGFTARQWDYARANGRENVWTPQLVVNGQRATVTGRTRGEIDALITRAGAPTGGPAISVMRGAATLSGAARQAPATVWLVRYDPRELAVPITAGENNGRTLPHRNIVRALVRLGDWRGGDRQFRTPSAPDPAWLSALLVQAGPGGAIIAARRI